MTIARVGTPNTVVNSSGGTTAVSNYVPTAGNLCVVTAMAWSTTVVTLTLADSRGNAGTSSPVVNAHDAAGPKVISVYVVPIVTGGAGTFTVTASAAPSSMVAVQVAEYSGCDSAGALDGTPVAAVNGAGTSCPCGGTVTLANSTSLLYSPSFWGTNESSVSNSLTGSSQRALTFDAGSGDTFEIADAIGNAAGGYSNTKTGAASAQSAGALVGVKAAAGGAAPILMGGICL